GDGNRSALHGTTFCTERTSYGLHRPVNRLTRLREEVSALLVDVHVVLEPDAELAGYGDHRLVAETHAGLDRRRVGFHEVRPLVVVEADAVAGPVGQAWKFVSGPEAGVGDHLACGRVDRLARRANPHRLEGGGLRALLEFPDVLLPLCGLAEDRRSGD